MKPIYGFCVPCDDVVETVEDGCCRWCNTPTEPIPHNTRERGDDDGREYGHPGDRLRGLE